MERYRSIYHGFSKAVVDVSLCHENMFHDRWISPDQVQREEK
jgi:hypothetical protein